MTQQQKEEAARRRKLDQEQTTEAKEAEARSTGLLPVVDTEQAAAATKVTEAAERSAACGSSKIHSFIAS